MDPSTIKFRFTAARGRCSIARDAKPNTQDRHRLPARRAQVGPQGEDMDQEAFNLSIRKFLKTVGVRSQREIEQAVHKALEDRAINGEEVLSAVLTLQIPALGLKVPFDGEIRVK
jgi:hypothetical protein